MAWYRDEHIADAGEAIGKFGNRLQIVGKSSARQVTLVAAVP
jgi:hypothetical protein